MSGNFLYKWTFVSQKENLCPVFRTWTGSQWPLAQNNPCVKEAYLGVA